jgi:uncharacterized membrane protein
MMKYARLGSLALFAVLATGCADDTMLRPDLAGSVNAAMGKNASGGYEYDVINVPGATLTQVWRMNARGEFVGRYIVGGRTYGFLFRGGEFEQIEIPGATVTVANGINERGDIVGTYVEDGVIRGFLLSRGTLTTVEFPDAAVTRLWDINANGVASGDYQLTSPGTTYTFTWQNGTFTPVTLPNSTMSAGYGINNQGAVAGHYRLADASQPSGSTKMMGFIWHNGSVTHVNHPSSGAGMSCLQAVGVHGEGVGHWLNPQDGIVYGFVWHKGQFGPNLRVPEAPSTFPLTITPTGVIAGYFIDAGGVNRGFIASPRNPAGR